MPVTSPSTGPVEWVALTFPGPVLDPAVVRPLADLVGAGSVRILDSVVVHKAPAGTVAEALGRPPAPVPAPGAASVDELYAQLTKLGELRQAGLLSDDEFARQKARLLA